MTGRAARTSRAPRVLAGIALVAAVLLVGGRGTLAYFTDSSKVTGTTITTGSIDLKVNGADNDDAFTSLGISGLLPGETTAAIIVVKNSGRSPLTYTVDSAATNTDGKNLASVLVVKVTGDSAVTGSGHARTCSSTKIAGSANSFTTGLIPTARTLAPGAQESLCVQATLPNTAPISTTTTYQNASTDVTFAFHAGQVIS